MCECWAVDGAVVMGKNNELLGFGGMISGRLPDVESVASAGPRRRGGRRRGDRERGCSPPLGISAGALPGSVAVVISQDGGVRFICHKGGRVTYWEQE